MQFNGTISTTLCSIKYDFKILICVTVPGTGGSNPMHISPGGFSFPDPLIMLKYEWGHHYDSDPKLSHISLLPAIFILSMGRGVKSCFVGAQKKCILTFTIAREVQVKMVKDHTQRHKLQHKW
jgi:hypothetical protein